MKIVKGNHGMSAKKLLKCKIAVIKIILSYGFDWNFLTAWCFIRYLDLDHKRRIVEEYLPKQTVEQLKKITKNNGSEVGDGENVSEPPKKKQKLKGRNKQVGHWRYEMC